MSHPQFFPIARLGAVLVLALSASGCVATVPAMLAYSYATTGAVLGMGAAQTAIAYKRTDIAQ